MDPFDVGLVFRLLPRSTSDDVFSYLESSEKDELLRDLTDGKTRRLPGTLNG